MRLWLLQTYVYVQPWTTLTRFPAGGIMLLLRLALRQDKAPCWMDGGPECHPHYRTCTRSVFALKPRPLLWPVPRERRRDRLHSRSSCLCESHSLDYNISPLGAGPLGHGLIPLVLFPELKQHHQPHKTRSSDRDYRCRWWRGRNYRHSGLSSKGFPSVCVASGISSLLGLSRSSSGISLDCGLPWASSL